MRKRREIDVYPPRLDVQRIMFFDSSKMLGLPSFCFLSSLIGLALIHNGNCFTRVVREDPEDGDSFLGINPNFDNDKSDNKSFFGRIIDVIMEILGRERRSRIRPDGTVEYYDSYDNSGFLGRIIQKILRFVERIFNRFS
ncbi:hypothetical protein SSS_10000 [Sarcoptes scabiei]|nr:hypothetical protein SSS_10000 [Sarcoptes scabiei]